MKKLMNFETFSMEHSNEAGGDEELLMEMFDVYVRSLLSNSEKSIPYEQKFEDMKLMETFGITNDVDKFIRKNIDKYLNISGLHAVFMSKRVRLLKPVAYMLEPVAMINGVSIQAKTRCGNGDFEDLQKELLEIGDYYLYDLFIDNDCIKVRYGRIE